MVWTSNPSAVVRDLGIGRRGYESTFSMFILSSIEELSKLVTLGCDFHHFFFDYFNLVTKGFLD